jgi:hypothetical protein
MTRAMRERQMPLKGDLVCSRTSWHGPRSLPLGKRSDASGGLDRGRTHGGVLLSGILRLSNPQSTLGVALEDDRTLPVSGSASRPTLWGAVHRQATLRPRGPQYLPRLLRPALRGGSSAGAFNPRRGARRQMAEVRWALDLEVRRLGAKSGCPSPAFASVARSESVVYFNETVTDERKADHFFTRPSMSPWVRHSSNLSRGRVAVSAIRGRTYPHGYENKALLESSRDFRWRHAPGGGARIRRSYPPLYLTGAGLCRHRPPRPTARGGIHRGAEHTAWPADRLLL